MADLDPRQPLPRWTPTRGSERDPERIDVFLEQLRSLWNEHPSMRFGQLLVNLCDPNPNALFDVEDHEMSERIFQLRETGVWPTASQHREGDVK